MPVKLRPSQRTWTRTTNSYTTKHFFIKNMSDDSLFEELNKGNTKPKVKQKLRNEIVRRGINIEKRTPNA